MQIPATLMTTARRVALPAVPRLLEAGRDPCPLMECGVAGMAQATGLVVVGMGGGRHRESARTPLGDPGRNVMTGLLDCAQRREDFLRF